MSSTPENQSVPSFMTDSGSGDSEKSMPLGAVDMIEDVALDPLAGVGEGRKFKAGSLILVVVIVMACAGLWFMKSLSKVGAASVGNSEVEASIEKFISGLKGKPNALGGGNSSALTSGDASILAVLSGSYTERQIPLDGVQRNPFILYGEAPVAIGSAGDDQGGRRRGDRQALFEKAAARLELKSVLMSSQPLANINGKIVRKGEEIVSQPDNLTFRVAEIHKDYVTVIGEDPSVNLSVPFTIVISR